MFLLRYTFILLIFLAATLQVPAQTSHYDPSRSYSKDYLKADLHILKDHLKITNPGLYRYLSRVDFAVFFDSLDRTIDRPMNEQEFLRSITLINGRIGDGHTMFLPSAAAAEYNNTKGKFLPFSVVYLGGKLYITENCSADSTIRRGEEVLRINGTPVPVIMEQLLTRQIRDANNQNYPLWILNHYFTAYYSFSFGQPDQFLLELKEGDEPSHFKNITALTKDSIRHLRQLRYPANKSLGVTLEEEGQTCVLTIKSFDPDLIRSVYQQDFHRTIDSVFVLLKRHGVKNLILDLRDNQGGDFEPGRHLLSYLLLKPSLFLLAGKASRLIHPRVNRFAGGLFVLINGGSFSNTAIVSSILEREKRAIFIGEETGGNKYIISGDPVGSELPHTRIQSYISTTTFWIRRGKNDGRGVVPSYPIAPTIGDILSQKDAAKECAFKLASPL